MLPLAVLSLAFSTTIVVANSLACIASGDETTINNALRAAGNNGLVQLCPSAKLQINNPITFSAGGQEISTQGYPTDSTRATIIISPSNNNNLSTLIGGGGLSGLKLKSLIVDGNRGLLGHVVNGGANIELGSTSSGLVVTNVASKNTRGWSCLHVIEGSTTGTFSCTNATISNNDIGPCGTEDAGLWADGISFACANSLVSSNIIIGPTDGGIVVFGAPGSTITNNTIIGSDTQRGFGAINMVDYLPYAGNYANVKVTNNKIQGRKMFNIGIAVGGHVWSSQSDPLTGPATVTGNTISGNVTFPIALNGWQGGITITGTNVTGVSDPSSFADAVTGNNDCQSQHATWNVFNAKTSLSYWAPGVNGTRTLDAGFQNSTKGSPGNYLCTQPALNSTITFAAGSLFVNASRSDQVALLHKGFRLQLQGDNNLVAINLTIPDTAPTVFWASGKTTTCGSMGCALLFQGDGNLVNYANGKPVWASNTASANGSSYKMVIRNTAPWIQVTDSTGKVLWNTTQLV